MLPSPTEAAPAARTPIDLLSERIDAALPQTQCERCGYPGCQPYARAVAEGAAAINQCPPGGDATIQALADLTGRPLLPLDTSRGEERAVFTVAWIEESDCIGCFKCVQVCPVDAIVGAPAFMHTVIAEQCSGCDLCVPVCPTDCIHLLPRPDALPTPAAMAPRWRSLFDARAGRLAGAAAAQEAQRRAHRGDLLKDRAAAIDITEAVARSRARRQGLPQP